METANKPMGGDAAPGAQAQSSTNGDDADAQQTNLPSKVRLLATKDKIGFTATVSDISKVDAVLGQLRDLGAITLSSYGTRVCTGARTKKKKMFGFFPGA